MVIIVVLSAVAISKVSGTSIFAIDAEFDLFKTNFRYAQIKALSGTGSVWGITVNAGTPGSYTLTNTAGAVKFPMENSATHTLPAGFSFTAGTGAIVFDDYGSHGNADVTITMTDGATPANTRTIIATANTGYLR